MENVTEFDTITKANDGNLQLNLPRAKSGLSSLSPRHSLMHSIYSITEAPCYPMLYVEADLGRLVALCVKNFDKVQGKTIKAFDRCYSGKEMVQIIEKVSSSSDDFRQS